MLSIFAARLVQLQGLDPEQYATMAAEEGSETIVLPARRGDILDRKGEPLAASASGLMVVADPALTVERAPSLARFLAARLGVDYFTTLQRLRAPDSRFQYIARQVPASIATEVVQEAERRDYDGLATHQDPLRTYPGRDIAANVLGFLGAPRPDGSARPSAGLEAAFNDYLSGTDGVARYQIGAGSRIPLGSHTVTAPRDGGDLQTTIDQELQWYAQRVLRETVRNARGDSGYAVVMDSRTGELLAVADDPTYNASSPQQYPKALYNSRALTDVYEPGSVEKVLTMAGLLDAGLVTPTTRFTVPPVLNRQDRPINDYFEHGTIRLTLAGILAKSSNIGTVRAADHFRPGQLRRYLTAFGLGQRTGIGLDGETRGLLPDPAMWTSQTGDRIAFGQSLSVNAIQMAAAVNTIANGGVRVDPSLLQGSATTDDGVAVGTDTVGRHRVVSEEAASGVAQMMERVSTPRPASPPVRRCPGTGWPARPAPHSGWAASAAATTAPSRCPSRASRPPTTPGSRSTWWCRTRATAAAAVRSAARRSRSSWATRCAATASRRRARRPPDSPSSGDRRDFCGDRHPPGPAPGDAAGRRRPLGGRRRPAGGRRGGRGHRRHPRLAPGPAR